MSNVSIASHYGNNYAKIQDPKNVNDTKHYQTDLEKSRLKDVELVMKSVNDLRSDLESLKSEVLSLKGAQNTDCLKKKMLGMEGRISNLKEAIKQELGTLLKDEIILLKEMQFTEKRIAEWDKPINSKLFKANKPSSYRRQRISSSNPTTEFQKFVASFGGHYGGWQEQDHLLFLRERNKCKGKEKFLSVVHSLIPGLSYEEIEEHEKWYVKYESLKTLQKEAIQQWKSEKEMQQNKQKEKKEQKEEKPLKKVARQQRNIAERIKEWKNRQLQMKLEEEARQKAEKEKLKEEEKKRKEIYKRKKSAVNEYKAQKLNKFWVENAERQNLQNPERKTVNQIMLKTFRLEDAKFIEKKRMIRLQLESKTKEKLGKLRLTKSSLEAILRRDPQRVFQPTFIWTRHCLQEREQVCPVFNLNAIPRLAIPEWRRELK